MSSDEERLEEMLKAVMETEDNKVSAPEVPEEDFPEIPMEDFPEIPMEDFPEISMDEISEMPMDEIPEISMDEEQKVPVESSPEMSVEETADMPSENIVVAGAENSEEPEEQPQERREKEPEVDPLELLAMSEAEIDKVLENEAAAGEGFSGREDDAEVPLRPEKDGGLSDIEELLQMSDNHEQVDDSEKPKTTPSESPVLEERDIQSISAAPASGGQSADEVKEAPEKGRKKKEKRQKKEKKEKKKADSGEKKEGFGKRLALLFFGSDDELEEEDAAGGAKGKDEAADAERSVEGKGKKKKEKKKKEPKKKEPKKKEPDPGKAAKEKLKKEKSAEKAKKKAEKAEKAEKEKRAAKKLPKKKVIVWVVFCASIGAGILLLNTVGMSTIQLTDARNAFDDKDFETTYRLLNGKELSEEDQLLFSQSSAILHLKHAGEAYENHLKLEKPVKALNDLLIGVAQYQELLQNGRTDLITPELTAEYQNILKILQEGYSLSEEGAIEINALESDYEYSLQLEALVNGTVYQSQAELEQQEEEETANFPDLEDMLPEEEEFFNDSSD